MSGRVLLISLRCNPAHIQLLIAYARAIQSLGQEAVFLLDPAYSRFLELGNAAPVLLPGPAHLQTHWDSAIFMNPSLRNLETAKELKRRGAKVIYVLHEPWQMSWQYVKHEGLRAAWTAFLAHRATAPVLRAVDHIILPSQYGLQAYRSTDARLNGNASYIPLLYEDDLQEDIPTLLAKKEYFSYIGNPCRAHGFDQFLEVIRLASRKNLGMRFLIATGHELPREYTNDPVFSQQSNRVEVHAGRRLSNDEINHYYARSICVWNLYRRSTQSGVLPKAFMFGAPVICSDVGSFPEYVVNGYNGEMISSFDGECIIEAFQRFQKDLAVYAAQCRCDFLSTFYYRAHIEDLSALLV